MNEEDLLIDERVTAAIEQMFLILLVRFTEMSIYILLFTRRNHYVQDSMMSEILTIIFF